MSGVESHSEMRRAFSVEIQSEFDGLTKSIERRVFTKVYVYARTSGLIAALGPRGWQTLSVLATYMDADGNCFPSQSEIADALRITRQAANERLKELLAFRWEGKPIVMACKVRGDGQKFANTRYTILPVTGFQFGPGSAEQAMSSGGDMGDTQAMSSGDDMGSVGAVSSAIDTNKIRTENAVLFDGGPSASGMFGKKQEINTARAPAREQKINTTREGRPAPRPPEKNPDILPLLSRHAEAYRNTVGAAFPVAWAKDGAIVKRLLKTYSRSDIELLQDAFFAQKADSQAARRGYTVAQFAYEAPALLAAIKLREGLTGEQREIVLSLRDEGVTEDVAVALVHDYGADAIRRQIEAHLGRKERYRNPTAALVKAIREGWSTPEPEPEPDYFQPIKVERREDAREAPAEFRDLLNSTVEQMSVKVGRGVGS